VPEKPSTGELIGIVTAEGRPVSRVFVTAVRTEDGRSHRTLSSADGSYALSVPPGHYEVVATHPRDTRLRTVSSDARDTEVVADRKSVLDVAIATPSPPATIALPTSNAAIVGRVVDDNGDPVPHAVISALPSRPGQWAGAPSRAVTGVDGSFVIAGAPAGPVRVVIVPDRADRRGRVLDIELLDGDKADLGIVSL
jgi:hypothetical protein